MDEYLNEIVRQARFGNDVSIIDNLLDRIIDEHKQKIKYRDEYVLLEALRYKISDMTDDQILTVKEIREVINNADR